MAHTIVALDGSHLNIVEAHKVTEGMYNAFAHEATKLLPGEYSTWRDKLVHTRRRQFFLCRAGTNELVSYASVRAGQITVFVLPKWRGNGYGRATVLAACDLYKDNCYYTLTTTVDNAAAVGLVRGFNGTNITNNQVSAFINPAVYASK